MRPKHARPATKADETDEFREFWGFWSNSKCKTPYCARAAARDAFFRHVWWRDADPQDIIDGARHYEANLTSDRKQYKVENWMDRGFYEDDAEKWRAFQARQSQQQANVVPMRPKGVLPDDHFSLKWEREQRAKQG